MRALLVEDDALLVRSLRRVLTDAGYALDVATNAREALALGMTESYAVSVVDIGLPDGNGLDVIRQWRDAHRDLPVLILTARGDWQDKVSGLGAGGDDYLVKPFHPEELLARLKALIRRSHGILARTLDVAGFTLDEERQSVRTPAGDWHTLTGTEFRLLRYLMHRPDRILSKADLLEQLYNLDAEPTHNLIEAYVRRLRKILGTDAIRTLRGQGYVFPSQ